MVNTTTRSALLYLRVLLYLHEHFGDIILKNQIGYTSLFQSYWCPKQALRSRSMGCRDGKLPIFNFFQFLNERAPVVEFDWILHGLHDIVRATSLQMHCTQLNAAKNSLQTNAYPGKPIPSAHSLCVLFLLHFVNVRLICFRAWEHLTLRDSSSAIKFFSQSKRRRRMKDFSLVMMCSALHWQPHRKRE